MRADTVMNITGDAAVVFADMMRLADREVIRQRDLFIADVETEIDENGSLIIEGSELDIDLAVLSGGQDEDVHGYFVDEKSSCYCTGSIRVDYVADSRAVARLEERFCGKQLKYWSGQELSYSIFPEPMYAQTAYLMDNADVIQIAS